MSRAASQNLFLASLPSADMKRWLVQLQLVKLEQGDILVRPGERATDVYFPTSVIVSITCASPGHRAAEIGMVGKEGFIGASLLDDDEGGPPNWAVVQSSGWAFRLNAQWMRNDLAYRSMAQLILRHTMASITQIAQTAACGRRHSLAQQLSRWVLSCLDRMEGADLRVTQSDIAATLGVRRASVSECVQGFERDGLIRHDRGQISVLDRVGLEARSCDCYAIIRNEYRRLRLAAS